MPPESLEGGVCNVQESQPSIQKSSNMRTLLFMATLSFVCALILSVLASVLAQPKEIAKELDRIKEMMIAAKILNHQGHFLVLDQEGKYVNAKALKDGVLVADPSAKLATQNEILDVYKKRLIPLLVDDKGNLVTFEQAKIDQDEYVAQYRKTGYYKQPLKLIYEILPNANPEGKQTEKEKAMGYVIPVNGYGLWDAIYGYLAVKPDGNTVIGITWYDQKETPGLGANISETYWQNLFPGKHIFQESADGKTNFKTAPLGITVVKGKVADVLDSSPKSKSAVDGMAGATLTGNGVTDAYRDVLTPYRPFFIKIHEANKDKKETKEAA
jgi:Na+-transporting NADH:ubiquinone oxidoreductase subunit C